MGARENAKRLVLDWPVFSILFGKFRARKYFTDHQTPYTTHGFGDSVLVCKIHDCYYTLRKYFEQYVITSHPSSQRQASIMWLD